MPSNLYVFTFKQGLLSPLAHDLQLSLSRFWLELSGEALSGGFALDSLHVDGAVKRGRLDAGTLSETDRAAIELAIAEEILHTARHPDARFTGRLGARRGSKVAVEGELMLADATHAIACELEVGARIRGEVELVPSRWGIAPYRALGGALKLQDRVRIEIDLDASGMDVDRLPQRHRWEAGGTGGQDGGEPQRAARDARPATDG